MFNDVPYLKEITLDMNQKEGVEKDRGVVGYALILASLLLTNSVWRNATFST